MTQKNFMIKNGLRVGDSDLFVTSTGTTVKELTVGNVSIPSTIGSDNQVLKVVSGSLTFANVAGIKDSDLTVVANLQNKVNDLIARADSDHNAFQTKINSIVGFGDSDLSVVANLSNKVNGLINRLDSDEAERQISTLVVDSDGQILLNTNDDIANSGTLTIDSDGDILFLTGNDTVDSVGNAILSLRADRDSDSSKLGKINEIINRLDSDSAAIQSLATKTRADLDSDSIIIQQLKTAVNANTAARTNSSIDDNGDAIAITIDSSENVGIGTGSPSEILEINSGIRNIGAKLVSTDNLSVIAFKDNSTTDVQYLGANGDNLVFHAGTTPTERMRIDSSGNLLVGKTSTSTTVEGVVMDQDGFVGITRSLGNPLSVLRRDSNGDIIQFYRDATNVGSIGVAGGSNNELYLYSQKGFVLNNNGIIPSNSTGGGSDNTTDLGQSDVRFKDLYLSGGAYIGGTGSANHLDDYEEGTWTPQAGSESGVFTAGYAGQAGYYTKIGNRVIATFDITLSSRTLSGSIAFLYGLPFAVRNNGDLSGSFGNIATTNNKGANFYQISIYAQNNASYCYLTSTQSNTAELGAIANTFWGASTRLAGGVIYNTV